jgi:[histone H3]-lysine9 N-trimethyltransferase SUV39H
LEPYVVDGEHFGGLTRFMNHSCQPNCRQYAVSFNKNDPMIYEIAFFAINDITAGEELTFDYMDQDDEDACKEEAEEDPQEQDQENRTRCLCGATRCRKWLWI